jgi:hypothetical protein
MDLRKGLLPAVKKYRFYFRNIQHKRVYLLIFLLVRQNTSHRGKIPDLHREVLEAFAFFLSLSLFGYYVALAGGWLPTFRGR